MSDKKYELEFLKMENSRLKKELEESTSIINPNELMEIINIASDMRHLLERCRSLHMPIELAKSIDGVLSRARDYDE